MTDPLQQLAQAAQQDADRDLESRIDRERRTQTRTRRIRLALRISVSVSVGYVVLVLLTFARRMSQGDHREPGIRRSGDGLIGPLAAQQSIAISFGVGMLGVRANPEGIVSTFLGWTVLLALFVSIVTAPMLFFMGGLAPMRSRRVMRWFLSEREMRSMDE